MTPKHPRNESRKANSHVCLWYRNFSRHLPSVRHTFSGRSPSSPRVLGRLGGSLPSLLPSLSPFWRLSAKKFTRSRRSEQTSRNPNSCPKPRTGRKRNGEIMKQPGLTLRLPSEVLPRIDVKLNGILKKMFPVSAFKIRPLFATTSYRAIRSMELITIKKQNSNKQVMNIEK